MFVTELDKRYAVSPVDFLSQDLFKEGVEFASNVSFAKSRTNDTVRCVLLGPRSHSQRLNRYPVDISVFETTIRYLGGLLSAYELSDCQYPALLTKATEVADTLSHAWVGVRSVVAPDYRVD